LRTYKINDLYDAGSGGKVVDFGGIFAIFDLRFAIVVSFEQPGPVDPGQSLIANRKSQMTRSARRSLETTKPFIFPAQN
jgi:hypothetical protein